MGRDSLYKSLSEEGNPALGTVLKATQALVSAFGRHRYPETSRRNWHPARPPAPNLRSRTGHSSLPALGSGHRSQPGRAQATGAYCIFDHQPRGNQAGGRLHVHGPEEALLTMPVVAPAMSLRRGGSDAPASWIAPTE